MRPPRRAGKETPASAKLTLIIGRVTSGARPPRVGYLGQTGPRPISGRGFQPPSSRILVKGGITFILALEVATAQKYIQVPVITHGAMTPSA